MEEEKHQEEAAGFETEDKDNRERQVGGDEDVLQFLDSMDSYLTLLDSLSPTLRRGWLDLASARHSMGVSRINGALLDLKLHSAATSVQVKQEDEAQLRYVLHKWASVNGGRCLSEEHKSTKDKLLGKSDCSQLRQRGNPQLCEKNSENGAQLDVDDQVHKERARSLSMFGTLVSPKLQAAQLSFETALETLVEIANMRSAMLSSLDRIHKALGHRESESHSVPQGCL